MAAEDSEISDFPNPFTTAYETKLEHHAGPSLPCVGCGWCCLQAPCETSHRKYGYRTRCPDLFWDEKQHRYQCLLMLDSTTRENTRREQSEGQGCCAPHNPWRMDVRNRDIPEDQELHQRNKPTKAGVKGN